MARPKNVEGHVDVGQREGRHNGRGLGQAGIVAIGAADPEQPSERRVSDADLPLQYFSGKKRHSDFYLAGRHLPEQRRDLLNLGAAGGGTGYSGRHVNQIAQQHTGIVAQRAP